MEEKSGYEIKSTDIDPTDSVSGIYYILSQPWIWDGCRLDIETFNSFLVPDARADSPYEIFKNILIRHRMP